MITEKRIRTACVIPARLGSTRLKNKPLVDIKGKSLIRRVYENITQISQIDEVIIAADDDLISDNVKSFGGNVVLTPDSLQSGTDRVAYVARDIEADVIINVQCDEPFIRTEMIIAGLRPFIADPDVVMGSLKTRIRGHGDLFDPNVVKVVTDDSDNALYFSRFAIPYQRDLFMNAADLRSVPVDLDTHAYYKHLGIYFYRPDFLQTFAKLPVSRLEKAERLEQLRALENGYKIIVPATEFDSIGVDTEEDLRKVKKIFYEMESET